MSIEEEIIKGILSVIENISNAQLQQKTWVEEGGHPYTFFKETMHQLFDDYELAEILNNYKNYGISSKQYKILNKFYELIDQYSDEKMSWVQTVDPKEIVKDPRWRDIQKMAKEVLKAFNFYKE